MSNGHGSSRRQAYGKRMKDLRKRRDAELEIDLEGPSTWSRGSGWDEHESMHRARPGVDVSSASARPR
jgi:hypothetical protein